MNSCKRITIGILAHVDAGKTTLSESLLYLCGAIRQAGRVDHKDTFLDTAELERERGITIFSKQAELTCGDTEVILLDTPGHVDFSAEMERVLSVLDYAVLVVSGREGVQGHTVTLWKLLETYSIPTFIWVNKMDMDGAYPDTILDDLRENLSENIARRDDYEQIAMCEAGLLDEYIENDRIDDTSIAEAIRRRSFCPVFFGSALKMDGVDELIKAIDELTIEEPSKVDFGAKVFKITRDAKGERLTHMKLTGGSLSVRENIEQIGEKVSQIRIYSGAGGMDDNESSLCILFQTENCDILLTGDRSAAGELELLERLELPKLDVLVAGHHGSKNSTSQALLDTTQPQVVVISVGENNAYGHPAEELLWRLEELGCTVFRTDLDGTITIRR